MSKLFELNKEHFNEQEVAKHNAYEISKGINEAYTYDTQLAIIFNALELIVADMEECKHKQELKELLEFRKSVKQAIKGE